jgi:hypothetical protein
MIESEFVNGLVRLAHARFGLRRDGRDFKQRCQ